MTKNSTKTIKKTPLSFRKSEKIRERIHNLIPGGAHTYSKGDDQFPRLSPSVITHGKGVYVWDPDGNKYMDCLMGLTSVSLGHAYAPVLQRVKAELSKGVNFSRPSIIEGQLAEKFLDLIPGHDMIKFGKNGSLVTTAAVKLARAYTGRNLVAFPANHPFYSYDDWFIGKTVCNRGVPESIQHLSVTFEADNLESLQALFEKHPGQIACVISEPEKLNVIDKDHLSKAIDLAHKHGALYIVDEMITGFKTGFPGSITKYKAIPDMATWGKGIANGFSLCALTGKKEIMELGGIRKKGEEKVFLISTTHGGETHSIAACMATIDEFKKHKVLQHNQKIGQLVINSINKIIKQKNVGEYISVNSFNWLPTFTFRGKNKEIDLGLKTLFMQEMLQQGFLFIGQVSPSFSLNEKDVLHFCNAFSKSIDVYLLALDSGYERFLTGEPIKPVFRKYL